MLSSGPSTGKGYVVFRKECQTQHLDFTYMTFHNKQGTTVIQISLLVRGLKWRNTQSTSERRLPLFLAWHLHALALRRWTRGAGHTFETRSTVSNRLQQNEDVRQNTHTVYVGGRTK